MKKILFAVLMIFSTFALASEKKSAVKTEAPEQSKSDVATFAGGCFWCMQPPYDKLMDKGVIKTTVGYSGGGIVNPTYEQVSSGTTGHAESIQIAFDPSKITYEKLVEIFFDNIDPTDKDGQFADRGSQYRPAIFYHNDEQKKIAESVKQKIAASAEYGKKPIAVSIESFKNFYPAEGYHQKYYQESPIRYKLYKTGSGRADFIEKHAK